MDYKDALIADLQKQVNQLRLELDNRNVKRLHQENAKLNKELYEKNALLLAYQDTVDTERKDFTERIAQEREKTKQWQQAYEQMCKKCEKLEEENAWQKNELAKYNVFRSGPSDEEPQEKEKGPSFYTGDYMD